MVSTTGWIVLGIVNIPVYLGIGWVMFNDWDDFVESVRFWLTPNVFSILNGEYVEDRWAGIRVAVWILGCAGCVVAEAQLISRLFG